MEQTRRDYNLVAKIFLAISMVATVVAIITNIKQIQVNSYLGYSNSLLIYGIIINTLILTAGILTFCKKRIGLISLVLLFFVRLFSLYPHTLDISYSYFLGKNSVLLIRDFLPFAIAMCFKKNGLSGWKSMLCSLESKENIDNDTFSTKEQLCEQAVVQHVDASSYDFNQEPEQQSTIRQETDNQLAAVEDNKEQTQKGVDIPEYANESDNNEDKENHTVSRKGLWIGTTAAAILILVFFAYIKFKPYPSYINRFGDKFRYTFRLPNNRLANDIYSMALNNRFKGDMFVVHDNGEKQVTNSNSYYNRNGLGWSRNLEDYLNNKDKIYAMIDTIYNLNEIDDDCHYLIKKDGDDWKSEVVKGYQLRYYYSSNIQLVFYYLNLFYYDMGAFNQFEEYCNNKENRHILYNVVNKTFRDAGTFEQFEKWIGFNNNSVDDSQVLLSIRKAILIKELDKQVSKEVKLMNIASSFPLTDSTLIYNLINYYDYTLNVNKIIDMLTKAYKFNKQNNDLISTLAWAHYVNNDFDKASEYADIALKIDPLDFQAMEVQTLLITDKEKEAQKLIKKSIDFGNCRMTAYRIYSYLLYKSGKKKEAREYYYKKGDLNFNMLHLFREPLKKMEVSKWSTFDFEDIEIGFSDKDGNMITDYGKPLLSKNSKYIRARAKVRTLGSGDETYECKLYYNGELMRNKSSQWYTYKTTVYDNDWTDKRNTYRYVNLGGWGNDSFGNWKPGEYRFEIWFGNDLMAEKVFYIH